MLMLIMIMILIICELYVELITKFINYTPGGRRSSYYCYQHYHYIVIILLLDCYIISITYY